MEKNYLFKIQSISNIMREDSEFSSELSIEPEILQGNHLLQLFLDQYNNTIKFMQTNHEQTHADSLRRLEAVLRIAQKIPVDHNTYSIREDLLLRYTKILNELTEYTRINKILQTELQKFRMYFKNTIPKDSNIYILYIMLAKCLIATKQFDLAFRYLEQARVLIHHNLREKERDFLYLKILFLKSRIYNIKENVAQQYETLSKANDIIRARKINTNFTAHILLAFSKLKNSDKKLGKQRLSIDNVFRIKSNSNKKVKQNSQHKKQSEKPKPNHKNEAGLSPKQKKNSFTKLKKKHINKSELKPYEQISEILNNAQKPKAGISEQLLRRPFYKRQPKSEKPEPEKSSHKNILFEPQDNQIQEKQVSQSSFMIKHEPSQQVIESNGVSEASLQKSIEKLQDKGSEVRISHPQKERRNSRFIPQQINERDICLRKIENLELKLPYLIFWKDRIQYVLKDCCFSFIGKDYTKMLIINFHSLRYKFLQLKIVLDSEQDQFSKQLMDQLTSNEDFLNLKQNFVGLFQKYIWLQESQIGKVFRMSYHHNPKYNVYAVIKYLATNIRFFYQKETLKELNKISNYNIDKYQQIYTITHRKKQEQIEYKGQMQQTKISQTTITVSEIHITQAVFQNYRKKLKQVPLFIPFTNSCNILYVTFNSKNALVCFDIVGSNCREFNENSISKTLMKRQISQEVFSVEISSRLTRKLQRTQCRIDYQETLLQKTKNQKQLYSFLKFGLISEQKTGCKFQYFFSTYFQKQDICYLCNVNNLGPAVLELTSLSTKSIYLRRDVLFKFELIATNSKTKCIKYIATKFDLECIIGQPIPEDLNKSDLFQLLNKLAPLLVYCKDRLYFNLGLIQMAKEDKYYYCNKFNFEKLQRNMKVSIRGGHEQFLTGRLKHCQVLTQKLIRIELLNKLTYAILTIQKYLHQDNFILFVYLPTTTRKYSIHLKMQLLDRLNLKNGDHGYDWNQFLNLIRFELQTSNNKQIIFMKIGEGRHFFVKESSYDEFVEISQQVYHIELRIYNKQNMCETSLVEDFSTISITEAINYKVYLRVYSLATHTQIHYKFEFLDFAQQILSNNKKLNRHPELKHLRFNLADVINIFNQTRQKIVKSLDTILLTFRFNEILNQNQVLRKLKEMIDLEVDNYKHSEVEVYKLNSLKKISLNSTKNKQMHGYLKLVYKGIFILKEQSVCAIYHEQNENILMIKIHGKSYEQQYKMEVSKLNIPFLVEKQKKQFLHLCHTRIFKSLKNKLLLRTV